MCTCPVASWDSKFNIDSKQWSRVLFAYSLKYTVNRYFVTILFFAYYIVQKPMYIPQSLLKIAQYGITSDWMKNVHSQFIRQEILSTPDRRFQRSFLHCGSFCGPHWSFGSSVATPRWGSPRCWRWTEPVSGAAACAETFSASSASWWSASS